MFGKVDVLSYSCGSGASCGNMCGTYCKHNFNNATSSNNNQGNTGQQAETRSEHTGK